MKSEFLSTAAHELRTPMTSVYGFAELMLRREMSPAQQREIFATIHRQAALMINIINELLDLSRIEARRGKDFELETLDLRALASALVHDFKPPADRALPEMALGALPVLVRVDRNKLAQAIGNVLSNAYKYSPDGGRVTLRMVAASVTESTLVGLEVTDQGLGMSTEHLARVGERFFRADASGNIPGTGLGLSIVKEIIELLGGSLEVHSAVGQGTAVTLWLPRAALNHSDSLLELA
jgi:signal transduction histidine kinase